MRKLEFELEGFPKSNYGHGRAEKQRHVTANEVINMCVCVRAGRRERERDIMSGRMTAAT